MQGDCRARTACAQIGCKRDAGSEDSGDPSHTHTHTWPLDRNCPSGTLSSILFIFVAQLWLRCYRTHRNSSSLFGYSVYRRGDTHQLPHSHFTPEDRPTDRRSGCDAISTPLPLASRLHLLLVIILQATESCRDTKASLLTSLARVLSRCICIASWILCEAPKLSL